MEIGGKALARAQRKFLLAGAHLDPGGKNTDSGWLRTEISDPGLGPCTTLTLSGAPSRHQLRETHGNISLERFGDCFYDDTIMDFKWEEKL